MVSCCVLLTLRVLYRTVDAWQLSRNAWGSFGGTGCSKSRLKSFFNIVAQSHIAAATIMIALYKVAVKTTTFSHQYFVSICCGVRYDPEIANNRQKTNEPINA